MAKLFDLTVPLSPHLPSFPGDPTFEVESAFSIQAGHPCNVSRITMGSHAGTHVDAPYHFVETGARVEPSLPLDLVTTRRYGSARLTVFAP